MTYKDAIEWLKKMSEYSPEARYLFQSLIAENDILYTGPRELKEKNDKNIN